MMVDDVPLAGKEEGDALRLILVRHGLSYNNYMKAESLMGCLPLHRSVRPTCTGWTFHERHGDAELTLPGRHQARHIGRVLGAMVMEGKAGDVHTGCVFCSQMARAMESAMEISAGLREATGGEDLPEGAGAAVVPIPYFSEITSGTRVQTPSTERFAESARRTRCHMVDRFSPGTWRASNGTTGFHDLQRSLKDISLPEIKRIVGDKAAILVGHGKHMRAMLGLHCASLQNAEPLTATYRLGTQTFEGVRRLPLRTSTRRMTCNEVMAEGDREAAAARYDGPCDPRRVYTYTVYEPLPGIFADHGGRGDHYRRAPGSRHPTG